MARIRTLQPLVPKSDGRTVPPPAKTADPHYLSGEHKAWRAQVLRNAGFRCQWIDAGTRCAKAAPHHRLFADHIKERQDGGDPLDPANGQCLCGQHHSLKTAKERAKRFGRG